MNPDTTTTRATRTEDRVGFGEKFAFGVGALAVFPAIAGVGSFAVPVYQMTLKAPLLYFGLARSLPRFLDAFFATWMGLISDNTVRGGAGASPASLPAPACRRCSPA